MNALTPPPLIAPPNPLSFHQPPPRPLFPPPCLQQLVMFTGPRFTAGGGRGYTKVPAEGRNTDRPSRQRRLTKRCPPALLNDVIGATYGQQQRHTATAAGLSVSWGVPRQQWPQQRQQPPPERQQHQLQQQQHFFANNLPQTVSLSGRPR